MKLAFIILAHEDPANLLRLMQRLLVDGDIVIVHWDKKNQFDMQAAAQAYFDAESMRRVRFARRVAVEWGRWSMVEATLAGVQELEQSGTVADYAVLLSGADYLIKPLSALKAFLRAHSGKEFIECVDPDIDPWVVQGLVKERFQHHHWFNWRDNPQLFDWSLKTQKKLGLKRKIPGQLKPHFGSQWWALTWPTLKQVLAISRRRAIRQFFKTTWVPDELFFQTLVVAVVPKTQIVSSGLTFYHFSHQGRPLVFYNDHFDFLSRQQYFLARKLSPQATRLRDRLDDMLEQPTANSGGVTSLSKQLGSYQHFIAVQWRGIPDRRVVGRQLDAWYGDLEWNKKPYFVILAYYGAQLEPLRDALNDWPGICCYRELFHGSHIDYGLPDMEHPFYPADKPALRDMKRPNFLVDLIHAHPDQLTGFILRLPSGNEMEKVVIFDPQATIVFVLPDDCYLDADNDGLDWHNAFDNMVMYDYLAELQRAGKKLCRVNASRHIIPADSIKEVGAYLCALQTTVSR
ncbi:MAG: beta-1,6-N-acetylglucosaminyltransferase [Methylovulum sp.]|nr:beta-1,6-N-acetylglucosaminyltransferase [Methylovulum sp.]